MRYLSSFLGTSEGEFPSLRVGSSKIRRQTPVLHHTYSNCSWAVRSSRPAGVLALDRSRESRHILSDPVFHDITIPSLENDRLSLAVMQGLFTLRYKYKPRMNVHNSAPPSFQYPSTVITQISYSRCPMGLRVHPSISREVYYTPYLYAHP